MESRPSIFCSCIKKGAYGHKQEGQLLMFCNNYESDSDTQSLILFEGDEKSLYSWAKVTLFLKIQQFEADQKIYEDRIRIGLTWVRIKDDEQILQLSLKDVLNQFALSQEKKKRDKIYLSSLVSIDTNDLKISYSLEIKLRESVSLKESLRKVFGKT